MVAKQFKLSAALAFCLLGLGSGVTAQAATATNVFTVSAAVLTNCAVTATNLVFGNYDGSTGADLDSTSIVTATCTSGTPYKIGLDKGAGSGATVAARKMASGANQLSYTLYQNSARTTVWGDTVGTNTMDATAGALPTNHTVYGRVVGGQNVPAGTYLDTINVTLTY